MQEKKSQKPMLVSQYANNLITDMKNLSNALKPLSKNLYESNNRILNELLIAKDDEIFPMINIVLCHTLQISQYKPLIAHVLGLLNKTIVCLKTLPNPQENVPDKESIQKILSYIIDVLIAGSTQHKESQETSLRILQTTFSLIDHMLIPFFNESMLTRMFSICFQFCQGLSIIQNISVSALFALVEFLFQFGRLVESFEILNSLLKYLFDSKKFIWIKGGKVKGLVWDLVVISIKNFTPNHIIGLKHHLQCQQNLNKMYDIVVENIFTKKNKDFYNVPQENLKNSKNSNANNKHYEDIGDFMRYFKAYVAISTSLSLEAFRVVEKQFVSFRATLPKLLIICDLERNSRMFIFLEAICQLLLNQYDMPLSLDKGMIFMEILSKISEELCLSNESIKVNWDLNENYIDKIVVDQPKTTDGDFVRLIKNTIVNLRTKFQKDEDLINCKKNKKNQKDSARSMNSSAYLPDNMSNSKKWENFIRNIIKIIRYLSSLNFLSDINEEDPTRKLILELQYWFLICPVARAKNMVLQELLITANVLNNKMQAIKVSQSVQIGSNILYGYYEDLDSIGLTIILKMMAGIKADWQEGKSFEELDEIYNLCSNIFAQQRLIQNDAAFLMTIQALVQCANSLIADIEQPKQKQNSQQNFQNTMKRSYKMINYLIQRLIVVINNNPQRVTGEWNFITAFFITLCFNKNLKIKEEGIKSIGILVKNLLKTELGHELDMKKELDILGLYIQLTKAQIKEIELPLIDQLKMIMPRITQEIALIDGFKIIKILSDNQRNSNDIIGNLHQLQEIFIKQCLYRITDIKFLKLILEGIQTKSSQKNQQYRLINLLWTIADYFRKITPKQNIPNEFIDLWETLFKSLWAICQNTKECETKQSAIHSITQILAQTSSLLPFDFIILIISKYYHPMVLLLLGIHGSSSFVLQSEKSPETAKVALKNYMKIFKKLISIDNKSDKDKKEIARNITQINSNITKFIQNHIQAKNTGNITLELLFEVSNFIFIMDNEKGFDEYGTKKDLKQMFQSIEDIIKMAQQMPSNTKMDLKSHMFKKKLKPLLEKIKQKHQSEKTQENFNEGKIENGQK